MVPFKVESWLWYSVVISVVIFRFISRVLHFKSIFRFQLEDYLMMFLACNYTTFIVLINICVHTNTNLIDPREISDLTPRDVAERTYGSQVNVAVEQTMCMTQWGTKACLLLLYYRLTENLVQNRFVKVVGAFAAVSFVVMEVLFFGFWCRPFSDYWLTPTDNVQCTTALHHLTVNLSFNLTSDILIMSVPLPLLLRARLEIKRKILLCLPFTLGFFSIVCAILSKYVSFTHPFSPVWVFWYTREASCVMIVANMPYAWGFARRVFNLQSFWGRGSSAEGEDSDEFQRCPETAMEINTGEVRQIPAREVYDEDEMTRVKKFGFGPLLQRVPTSVRGENPIKTISQVSVVTADCLEKSQTIMSSRELANG